MEIKTEQIAIQRDGTELRVGDLVETDYHSKCAGVIFEVEKLTPWETCESGMMVLVHVQGSPDRKLKTSWPEGLDANWFKKL